MAGAHYVPVLKGKEGERKALNALSDTARKGLTPLIEVPPLPWDFDADEPAATIDAHLAKFPTNLAKAWGTNQRLFLDLDLLGDAERLESDDRHPLVWLADELRALGVKVVPVVGIGRSPACIDAVRAVNKRDGAGVCLRVLADDVGDPASADATLKALLASLDCVPEAADLVIDFRAIAADQVAVVTTAALAILSTMEGLEAWRSLTLAATGFPEQLSSLGQGLIRIPRPEWAVWQGLFKKRTSLRRMPAFGDYAVQHPNLMEVDARIMRMAANLRYTTDQEWLIARGRDVRREGFAQFFDLARMISEAPEFYGADFSWGDWAIAEGSAGRGSTGNATTWRKIATSHHLTVVVTQLSALA
jgi:hypothetical protein